MRTLLLFFVFFVAFACPRQKDLPPPVPREPSQEVKTMRSDAKALATQSEQVVDDIQVQHVLISYKDGGIPGVSRSADEAEDRAAEVWAKAKAGEDFDALVKKYTDDQYPGIYGMTQRGQGDQANNIFRRGDMVAAFGEVGFRLNVGEVGVALLHPQKSPFGYHIIKRLK